MKMFIYVNMLLFALFISGCAHSDARSEQRVYSNNSVILDGSKSFSDKGLELKYIWKQVSGKPVGIIDNKKAIASFVAPAVSTEETFTFFLIVIEKDTGYVDLSYTSVIVMPQKQEDHTPPVISLNGDKNITLVIGESYNELGATATDNVDGNIAIVTQGVVDTSKEGRYTITYSATDKAGNTSSTSRTIIVQKGEDDNILKEEASAFLSRATFGAKEEEIDALVDLNNYEQWIDQQLSTTPTYHARWIEQNLRGIGIPDFNSSVENWSTYQDPLGYVQRDAWWHIATNAPDQLRQRVALAWSEIFVISRIGPLENFPDARVSYYDTLIKNAFGNFEDLLKDVTYHPAMGKYLSYLGNPKANPTTGAHPDENYAREVMQLFTIGLNELNQDGTKKLDNGKPISTYKQEDIQEMARVFTGLSDDSGDFYDRWAFDSSYYNRTKPMKAFEEEHDQESKSVLGHTIHTGSTKGDINDALHMLFMHENTAPFISKQLIQRLVTSNPTPAYVARVAAVFNNNGVGVRGDLRAVVKAILLDDEALKKKSRPDNFGKFREPLLYFTHLFRAFHAIGKLNKIKIDETASYEYESFYFNDTDGLLRQEGALEALTVFNYFAPTDGPSSLVNQHLVAPELMLYGKRGIDEVLMGIVGKSNFYNSFQLTIDLNFDKEIALVQADNIEGLLDHLSLLLTANTMDTQSKNKIVDYLKEEYIKLKNENIPDAEIQVVKYAISLVITSPAYALQR